MAKLRLGRSNSRAGARSAVFAVVLAGFGLMTTHCLLGGLDDYSAEYGVAASDGGPDRDADKTPDAGPDGSPDASPDAGCSCGPNEECVAGACKVCAANWAYDHKALSLGDPISVTHSFDASRKTLYVSGSKKSGNSPLQGYLAELDTCLGTLRTEHSGGAVQGVPIPGFRYSALSNGKLLLQTRYSIGDSFRLGGYARYDLATSSFESILDPPQYPATDKQDTWQIAVSQSGKVWLSGDWVPQTSVPILLQSDGQSKFCPTALSNFTNSGARAFAMSGDDVFVSIFPQLQGDLQVLRYSDSNCDLATCNCPVAETLPLLSLSGGGVAMMSKVIGGNLIVGGFVAAGTQPLFLSQYDLGLKSWTATLEKELGPDLDLVSAFDSDGSYLYAGVTRDYMGATTPAAELWIYPLPLASGAKPVVVPLSKLTTILSLDLDGRGGLLMSGYSADAPTDGRTIRCSIDAAKPTSVGCD